MQFNLRSKAFSNMYGKYETKSEMFLLMAVSHCVFFFCCFPPCMFQSRNAIIQVIGLWEECLRQERMFDQKTPKGSKAGGAKQFPWYFHFPSCYGMCLRYCSFWSPISSLIILVISEQLKWEQLFLTNSQVKFCTYELFHSGYTLGVTSAGFLQRIGYSYKKQ